MDLHDAEEEIPLQRRRYRDLLKRDPNTLEKKERKTLKRHFSRFSLRTRKRLDKTIWVLDTLRDDHSAHPVILGHLYKNNRPKIGYAKYRFPFPTNRRERRNIIHSGSIPKDKYGKRDTNLVWPTREGLELADSQFWLHRILLSLNQTASYSDLTVPLLKGMVKVFSTSQRLLDGCTKSRKSSWTMSIARITFYWRRRLWAAESYCRTEALKEQQPLTGSSSDVQGQLSP